MMRVAKLLWRRSTQDVPWGLTFKDVLGVIPLGDAVDPLACRREPKDRYRIRTRRPHHLPRARRVIPHTLRIVSVIMTIGPSPLPPQLEWAETSMSHVIVTCIGLFVSSS